MSKQEPPDNAPQSIRNPLQTKQARRIRISDDKWSRIGELAAKHGIGQSEYIRRLIDRELLSDSREDRTNQRIASLETRMAAMEASLAAAIVPHGEG
jgi:hypothetical protein